MQSPDLPLRDIHAAPAPPWWPPAWGWWVLAAVALVLLVWAGIGLRRYLARRRYRQALLREVDHIVAQWQADQNEARAVAALSVLLRRLVVHAGDRHELAGVAGQPWVEALQAAVAGDTALEKAAAELTQAPYRPSLSTAPDARSGEGSSVADFAALARRWAIEVSRV